jgi:hypothetical protein
MPSVDEYSVILNIKNEAICVHKAFFREELTHAGKNFDEKMDVVCEAFKVVIADKFL